MDIHESNHFTRQFVRYIHWCLENDAFEKLQEYMKNNSENIKLSQMDCDPVQTVLVEPALSHVSDVTNESKQISADRKSTLSIWLGKAFECRHTELVLVLVKMGADVDMSLHGKPLLHIAACDKNTSLAEGLIRGGADINALDKKGNGILHNVLTSPIQPKEQIVRWLINHGANTQSKGSSGKPLLHLAAIGSAEVIDILVQAGHDVNAIDDVNNDTPLHIACGICCKETILKLIQCGSSLNPLNKYGQTPLAKLFRFTQNFPDFHSRTRLNISKLLISVGCRFAVQSSQIINDKKRLGVTGRDKGYDRYTLLMRSMYDVPSLQTLSRVVIRNSLATGVGVQRTIDQFGIPVHLKSFLLFQDFVL